MSVDDIAADLSLRLQADGDFQHVLRRSHVFPDGYILMGKKEHFHLKREGPDPFDLFDFVTDPVHDAFLSRSDVRSDVIIYSEKGKFQVMGGPGSNKNETI